MRFSPGRADCSGGKSATYFLVILRFVTVASVLCAKRSAVERRPVDFSLPAATTSAFGVAADHRAVDRALDLVGQSPTTRDVLLHGLILAARPWLIAAFGSGLRALTAERRRAHAADDERAVAVAPSSRCSSGSSVPGSITADHDAMRMRVIHQVHVHFGSLNVADTV